MDEPLAPVPPWVLLWRGFTRRCPHCGSGGLFRRVIFMRERCPRRGLWLERVEGHWTAVDLWMRPPEPGEFDRGAAVTD